VNNMLTLEEVKSFLEVDQPELDQYIKHGKLHAYKIGGIYLRFRKEEVMNVRIELQTKRQKPGAQGSAVFRAGEFWRFNNFCIVSLLIILARVVFVVRY